MSYWPPVIGVTSQWQPRHDKRFRLLVAGASVTAFGQFEAWRRLGLLSCVWLWLTYQFGRDFLSARTAVLCLDTSIVMAGNSDFQGGDSRCFEYLALLDVIHYVPLHAKSQQPDPTDSRVLPWG